MSALSKKSQSLSLDGMADAQTARLPLHSLVRLPAAEPSIRPGWPQTMPENCPGELSVDNGVTELYPTPWPFMLAAYMSLCTLEPAANIDSAAGWTLVLNTCRIAVVV